MHVVDADVFEFPSLCLVACQLDAFLCLIVQVEVTDAALLSLIENYCREAGVRNLQKHIEKIYRKVHIS